MKHSFINRIACLVRENTSGETRNQLLHLELTTKLHHIHVHDHVIIVEFHLMSHVIEQTSDLCSQMNYMGGLILFENSTSRITISVSEFEYEWTTTNHNP